MMMFPLEICLQSIRVQRKNDISSEQYWGLMFGELTDLDEERLAAIDVLIRQKARVAKIYNKRIKMKTFVINYYV